ncbi:MAG: hypothetical protein ABW224_03110 [Kibdelosporangium sp.]
MTALGPFQEFWDVWDAADAQIKHRPLSHFRNAFETQFDELVDHLTAPFPDREAAAREATDIISIALNLMRRLGFEPSEVAEIARRRAETRMNGRTTEILEKYP